MPGPTVEHLKEAKAAYDLASRRVIRNNRAQQLLRDRHHTLATEHGKAKARYESIRDSFIKEVLST